MTSIRAEKARLAPLGLIILAFGCSEPSTSTAQPGSVSSANASSTEETAGTDSPQTSNPESTSSADSDTSPAPTSLLDAIQDNPQLSQLNKAIVAAGLEEQFQAKQPRTLFAPSNKAFEALFPGKTFLLSRDIELVRRVLKYHLLPGNITSESITHAHLSIDHFPILIEVAPDGTQVIKGFDSRGTMKQANLRAGNGMMHIIDGVLWPPEKNLKEILEQSPQFDRMGTLARLSGLSNKLQDPLKNYTVFVPNNDAIKQLEQRMGKGNFEEMKADDHWIDEIVYPHFHEGLRGLGSLSANIELNSLAYSSPLKLGQAEDPAERLTVNGRTFGTQRDIIATNGVIHEVTGTLHREPE